MIHCPNCAAGLRFEIETQQMACDHCGSHFDPAAIDDKVKDDAKSAEMFDSYVYVCPSCGAELMTTDETDAIGFCPFCGGASMLFDRIRRQWRPDYVIPFQITKEQCKELYVKAAKKSFMTSREYRDPALIDEFRGIYMPFWEYQAIQRGKYVLNGDKKGVFTQSFFEVSGDIDVTLDGYAHDASAAFDDRISEHIAPYDISGHKPFAPGYLSGFYADIGDVEEQEYYKKSHDCMVEDTARLLAEQKSEVKGVGIKKIKIDPEKASIPTDVTGAKRVLYPVWFMSYRNKDRITYAAVNGQTGKVSADFPASPLRIMLAVLLLGAALAAMLFFLPSVKANLTLAITCVLLGVGTFILRKTYNAVVNPSTGLDKTPEAQQFQKYETLRSVIVIVSVILGLIAAYMDFAYNVYSYALTFVMAAELFWLMIRHIRFQVNIAKRRPPQFNKKGAEYDEK